ncbi:hypothetical protein DSM3645_06564 [Blastopirellula marina DSM 3645]|uniref:Uncharacterized protein n=1 Tax=Blastopirellula marina DSM 3645 TaxID=314230 RepID=A4A142_9BACT|nr:hypothetical protein DSM3645_06564 [Blastopirellula marina DSM 3645]
MPAFKELKIVDFQVASLIAKV